MTDYNSHAMKSSVSKQTTGNETVTLQNYAP